MTLSTTARILCSMDNLLKVTLVPPKMAAKNWANLCLGDFGVAVVGAETAKKGVQWQPQHNKR